MFSAVNSQSLYQIIPEIINLSELEEKINFSQEEWDLLFGEKKKENFHVISDTAMKAKE